jgi:Na+-driven multidrug efflux pump
MVGKAIGAGDELLARHNASRLLKISALAGVAGSAVILLVRPFVASMMNLSPLADEYLRFLLLVMSGYVLCQAFTCCMVIGVLRGGGDTRFGLFVDTGTMWGFSIIFAALAAFVFHWPVKVVFVIIMCDEMIKLPLAAARYKSGRWLRNVTR